jgi:hypothetical protein
MLMRWRKSKRRSIGVSIAARIAAGLDGEIGNGNVAAGKHR